MVGQKTIAALKKQREEKEKKSEFDAENESRKILWNFHKKHHFWTCWRTEHFEEEFLMDR